MSDQRYKHDDSDERQLQSYGYKQDLSRTWGLFQNVGTGLSVLSVISGIILLFPNGIATGGPAVLSWTWVGVALLSIPLVLAVAELASAFPTAGGPYYWSAALVPRQNSALAAWGTAWFSIIGHVTLTTTVSYGLANLISIIASMDTYRPAAGKTIGIFAAIVASQAFANLLGHRILGMFSMVSTIFQTIFVLVLGIAVFAKAAPNLQSGSWVFGRYNDDTEPYTNLTILQGQGWVILIGALPAAFSMIGCDASAHASEETRNPGKIAPRGILLSYAVSALVGFFLLLALLFGYQRPDFKTLYGHHVLDTFVSLFGLAGAKALMSFVIISIWHCGLFSMASTSRVIYAFARDGGIPRVLSRVPSWSGSPVLAVILAAVLVFLLGLPSLKSEVMLETTACTAVAALSVTYIQVTFSKIIYPRHCAKGPFHLGFMSRPIHVFALLWSFLLLIIFNFARNEAYDINIFNYTPIIIGGAAVVVYATWFLFARKYYRGPLAHVVASEELHDVED